MSYEPKPFVPESEHERMHREAQLPYWYEIYKDCKPCKCGAGRTQIDNRRIGSDGTLTLLKCFRCNHQWIYHREG